MHEECAETQFCFVTCHADCTSTMHSYHACVCFGVNGGVEKCNFLLHFWLNAQLSLKTHSFRDRLDMPYPFDASGHVFRFSSVWRVC